MNANYQDANQQDARLEDDNQLYANVNFPIQIIDSFND